MNISENHINHISDTALWVAVYRAIETKRKVALFRDPYAEILAGEKGKNIIKNMKSFSDGSWSMIVRTYVIDKMIKHLVKTNDIDTIINLAAGLDTRPYRLELPPSLNWIEVDLPDILLYKELKLSNAKPFCKLSRVKLDLIDLEARKKLFGQISSNSKKVLTITEGLLVYLKDEDVAALAADLHSLYNFNWWIIDILSKTLLDWLLKKSFKSFTNGNVQMHFAPEEGAAFFSRYGWRVLENYSVTKESRRLKREMPMAWLWRLLSPFASKKRKEFFSQMDSYFILLERN